MGEEFGDLAEAGLVVGGGQDEAVAAVVVGGQGQRVGGVGAEGLGRLHLDAVGGEFGVQFAQGVRQGLEGEQGVGGRGGAACPGVDLAGGHPFVGGLVQAVVAQVGHQLGHGGVRVDQDGLRQGGQRAGVRSMPSKRMPRPAVVVAKRTWQGPSARPAR